MANVLLVVLVCILPVLVKTSPVHQLIELSYTYNEKTPNFIGHKKFTTEPAISEWSKKLKYWANNFCTAEHSGTHMDAPIHFTLKGRTIDAIPYEKLYRIPGIKIDVSSKSLKNLDYEISGSDMDSWVLEHGEIPDGAVVLLETGQGRKADDMNAYMGIDENGDMHFPGLGAEATKWLLDYGNRTGHKLGILGVGIDAVSLDMGNSMALPSHRMWLTPNSDRYMMENLKNIELLPPRGFTLTMMPMKIGMGTGSPTRVLAEIGGEPLALVGAGISAYNTSPFNFIFLIFTHFVLRLYV